MRSVSWRKCNGSAVIRQAANHLWRRLRSGAILDGRRPQEAPDGNRAQATADMAHRKSRPALGVLIFFAAALSLSAYFTFAAVQGDYGLFRRAEINVEARQLEAELAGLRSDVLRLENLTNRLSDEFLDTDLLDQQARDVLGMVRSDEVVVN